MFLTKMATLLVQRISKLLDPTWMLPDSWDTELPPRRDLLDREEREVAKERITAYYADLNHESSLQELEDEVTRDRRRPNAAGRGKEVKTSWIKTTNLYMFLIIFISILIGRYAMIQVAMEQTTHKVDELYALNRISRTFRFWS